MAAPNLAAVTSIYGRSFGAELTTTLTTGIFTCQANKVVKVNSILVANKDGTNDVDVTVYFFDNSAFARYEIASTITVPADSTLVVLSKETPLYLEEGDQLEAGASAAGDAVIIVSYEEIDDA